MFARTRSNLTREERAAGFSIGIGILVVLLLIAYFYNKKRRESFVNYAKKRGFIYREKDSHFPYRSTQIIATIDKNNDRSFENILLGDKDGVHFWTSDYNYKTFNSNTFRTREHNATVCVISRKKTNIPDFFVKLESSSFILFGKKQDSKAIVFDKDFSKKYTLHGGNEKNIRKIFDASVREAFIKIHQKHYNFEWTKDGLILFCDYCLSPDERMDMVKDASNIVEKILKTNS